MMLIRYYGHVGVPTGYGDAASEMCMAILTTGHDLEISTDGKEVHKRFMPLARCVRSEAELGEPDAIIVHTLPLDCGNLARRERLRERYPKAPLVAYTTWEGAGLIPVAMGDSLEEFHQVWVPSQKTRSCINPRASSRTWAGCGLLPPAVVPHPFDVRRLDTPHPLFPSNPYRFYYIGAWTARKNVEGLIRAYLRTFTADDPVELVIQSAGAPPSACLIAQFSSGIPKDEQPVIRFSNQRLSFEAIEALHRECHCFVTATRGEAWNIPAFDAVIAGRHVISTDGLGSDDYLVTYPGAQLVTSRPIPAWGDVRLVEAPDAPPGHVIAQYQATQGLTARSVWRDPCLVDLGACMLGAYKAAASQYSYRMPSILNTLTREAVGQLIVDLLLQGIAP